MDSMELADAAPGAEHELIEDERMRALRDSIRKLPERCRVLFELIFRDELNYDAIAEKLGIAPGTVKSRAARCREALSRELKSFSDAGAPGVTETSS
jgi:RNA polymerase sigma-70 factor (ECF subfamily)